MDPGGANLHAFFALRPLRVGDRRDGLEMQARAHRGGSLINPIPELATVRDIWENQLPLVNGKRTGILVLSES